MSLLNAYTSLARRVRAHRKYVFGVGLGGPVLLVALGVVASSFPWGSHTAARVVVLGGAWLIVLHWPLMITYFWFAPERRMSPLVAWSCAVFLSAYIAATLLGPPLVWLSPHLFG